MGTVDSLEGAAATKQKEYEALATQHEVLQRAHTALATEAAVKTQLLETLGQTARGLHLEVRAP